MNPTGYLGEFPDSRPRIFAHRGLVYEGDRQVVDENTIDSFELALAAGADYLETDLQLTKDGVAMLFHDSDLSRLVGSKKSISSLTHSELKKPLRNFPLPNSILISKPPAPNLLVWR
jgi:glycerophosphoryl diester phosphodiesterase